MTTPSDSSTDPNNDIQPVNTDSSTLSPFDPATATTSSVKLFWCGLALIAGLAWGCSGVTVVGADEAAVVRVCGRVERTANGSAQIRTSGLYFHFPWPISEVTRIRINEVRTITVGTSELGDIDTSSPFLRATDASQHSQLLSGDKNVLHLQLNISYRIDNDRIDDWLFGSKAVEKRLKLLASSVLADVVLRSGVDFVHTFGHNELRQLILRRLYRLVEQNSLGVDIEDVTIASVAPPVRVKADFVDVMNARADRETYINRARAYESKRQSDAQAEAAKLKNEAQSYAHRKIDLAKAEAESFNRLIDQFVLASEDGTDSYVNIRQHALHRHFIDTMRQVLQRVHAKVLLDSGKQVDITLHRNPDGQ